MTKILYALAAWEVAAALVALCVIAVIHMRERARTRKALSYCRRDAQGNVYVMDPQKGTYHRLDDLLVKRITGPTPHITPRQRKKVRREVRQALGAK